MIRPKTSESKYWENGRFRHLLFIEDLEDYTTALEEQVVNKNGLSPDVVRCFSMKENEIKDSIKYDIKYFGGNNVSKLTERLNAIEDLRDLVNRVVFK